MEGSYRVALRNGQPLTDSHSRMTPRRSSITRSLSDSLYNMTRKVFGKLRVLHD